MRKRKDMRRGKAILSLLLLLVIGLTPMVLMGCSSKKSHTSKKDQAALDQQMKKEMQQSQNYVNTQQQKGRGR